MWEDKLRLAFSAAIPATPFGRGVADFVAKGLAGASVYFTRALCHETDAGSEIAAAIIHDVCVTQHAADRFTACWLNGDAQPAGTLTAHAEALRERWLAGRDADLAAKLQAHAQPPYTPRVSAAPVDGADWANPPPSGFTLASWIDFGETEALHRWRWKQNYRERERRQRRRA